MNVCIEGTGAVTFDLPLPPSVNGRMIPLLRTGRLMVNPVWTRYVEGNALKLRAELNRQGGVKPFDLARIEIRFFFAGQSRNRDIDNGEKAILDVCEKAGIVKNDNRFRWKLTTVEHSDDSGVIVTVSNL